MINYDKYIETLKSDSFWGNIITIYIYIYVYRILKTIDFNIKIIIIKY